MLQIQWMPTWLHSSGERGKVPEEWDGRAHLSCRKNGMEEDLCPACVDGCGTPRLGARVCFWLPRCENGRPPKMGADLNQGCSEISLCGD